MEEKISHSNCQTCGYKSLIFEKLEEKELQKINLTKKEVFFRKGEIVYHEGQEINEFMYLKEGLVKLYKKGKNRQEQIISIANPLDFIGLLSIFSNSNYMYSISALEDSAVCIVNLDLIKELVKHNGNFAMGLLEKISKLADDILKTRIDLNNKHLRGRIAYIILYFSKQVYHSPRFDLPVSRKEIGELIEMRTENVIRILSEFRKDKIITIEGKNIEILDLSRLENISNLG